MTRRKSDQTRLVQAGIGEDPQTGSVATPLHTSSTYIWKDIETKGEFDYGRTKNPTRELLTRALVELEGGVGGEIVNSGMAAIDLCLNLLDANDLIIAPHDCYGGTHRLFTHRAFQNRIRVEFVDQSDEAALDVALTHNPKMVFIETPSNPLMRIVDVAAIAKAAKAVGALSVCDNTFLSPVRQKPLALGCDIVIHSNTKYINGHSDVVGGCVIANSEELTERLRWWANCAGLTGAPFDSWLTLRGMRTLPARMDIQEANAGKLATFLDGHNQVEKTYYPGLKCHPQFDLAAQQQFGPGAMLSFEIKGDLATAKSFLSGLELFQLAASLGGTESLICQPAIMTHAGMAPEARQNAGIKDNLIRVSVGMENIDDLLADFTQSFSKI
ncbi:MAG: cystathionine gamma-synthase [Hellea sp.]|nr:cystathionine gamma-synthase [Hellea sp.]